MRANVNILCPASSWMRDHISSLEANLKEAGCDVITYDEPINLRVADIALFLSVEKILPREVLEKARHNIVVHASDLPRGRGWSPLTWQILEGQNVIPIVVFEAVEQVDSGPIYMRAELAFTGFELIAELRNSVGNKVVEMCAEFIANYPEVTQNPHTQVGTATYYRRRGKEDSRLDPDRTIREQFNLLRVADNLRYPVFFDLEGRRYILKIEKAPGNDGQN